MEETSEYMMYDECATLSADDNECSKTPLSDTLEISPSLVLPPVSVSSVLYNSTLTFQEETLLHEENRNKLRNNNEGALSSGLCESLDNGSTYRLLLTPLSCSSVIKNNNTEKLVNQTLLCTNSNLSLANDSYNDNLIELKENGTKEISGPLLLNSNALSLNPKNRKNSTQPQVVVKFLQDDLNFDMVEIISPHIENSQIFGIIDKETNGAKENCVRENEKDASGRLQKYVSLNDIKGIQSNSENQCSNSVEKLLYKCSNCNKVFDTEYLVNQHKADCLSNSAKLPGDSLDNEKQFVSSNSDLATENGNPHSKMKMCWVCLICSSKFSSSLNLKNHYLAHNVEDLSTALLKCSKPVSLKTEKSVASECSRSTETKNHSSKKSFAKVNNKRNVQSLNVAAPTVYETNFQSASPKCNTEVEGEKNQPKNKKIKLSKKSKKLIDSGLKSRDPHTCPVCKKVISSRGNLAKHLIQHETIKPWVCKVCGAGFNSKRNHDHHFMQRHTTLRPNVCTICGKGFANKRTLTEHIIFHKKDKDFKCELCSKRFRTKKCVNRHMKRHEKNLKFVCNFCYKAFRVKVDLFAHMKLVHNPAKKGNKQLNHKTVGTVNMGHNSIINSSETNLKKSDHSVKGEVPVIQNNPHHSNEINLKKSEHSLKVAEAPVINQQALQIISNSDQIYKIITPVQDLLQSEGSTSLPAINDEIQTLKLSETKGTFFVSGEKLEEQQSLIPVSASIEHEHNSFSLSLCNKTAALGYDEASSTNNIFVMVGINDAHTVTQNLSEKNVYFNSHEYKMLCQKYSKESQQCVNTQEISNVGFLPTVFENVSRPYQDGIDQCLYM